MDRSLSEVNYSSCGALQNIYSYLNPLEVVSLRLINRELNMIVRQTLSAIKTREDA